ncbi:MAG: pimeloyl-ACP methyl ester esterase BioH [Gammaproteobacteria bacterium]|nr:pimeloyl-ACP methyl ester esterase BioH [Gammaproteobacteria bacterium]
MRLHTTTLGEGLDVVMLHGWGLNQHIWGDAAQILSQHARLTLVDLPGHGQSPMLENYTLEGVVNAALEVAPPNAVWLGWSLGGLVAMAAAEAQPQRCNKLVLVTANPCNVQRDAWSHAMQASVLEQFAQNLATDYDQTLQRFLMLQCKGSEHARETVRVLRERLEAGGRPQAAALRAGLALLQHSDVRPQLANIACNTLLIYGQHDVLVPASGAPHVAAMLPRARAEIIRGAAHAPFVSHLPQFIDLINGFLHT